jgi:nuclear pore complex protein Nup54
LFSSFQPTNQPSTLFNNTSSSFQISNQQQQQQPATPTNEIEKQLIEIKNAYDPNSPQSRFHAIFYNRIDPKLTAASYVQHQLASAKMWENAQQNNPDPSSFVPVLAIGFEDIRKRMIAQQDARLALTSAVESMQKSVEDMRNVFEANTRGEIEELRHVHEGLAHRLLAVLNRVDCSRAKDAPYSPEEVQYRQRLNSIATSIAGPNGLANRIQEMNAVTRARADRFAYDNQQMNTSIQLDPTTSEQIGEFLGTQTSSLEFLTKQLEQQKKFLDTILTDQDELKLNFKGKLNDKLSMS